MEGEGVRLLEGGRSGGGRGGKHVRVLEVGGERKVERSEVEWREKNEKDFVRQKREELSRRNKSFTLKIIHVKNFRVNKFSWFRSIRKIFLMVNGYNMDKHRVFRSHHCV